MTRNPVLTRLLARNFSRRLAYYIGVVGIAKANERNAAEPNPSICHSHDFCDANVAMAEAFEHVRGHEPDVQSESDMRLFSAAWDAAKRAGFNPDKI